MDSSFERSNRPVDLTTDEAHEFHLHALAAKVIKSEAAARSGRTALTLARHDRLTVVLTVMREGARLNTHKADHPITVSVLDGRIVFAVGADEKEHTLEPGGTLVLPGGLPHSARALSDSSFLLVIGGRGA